MKSNWWNDSHSACVSELPGPHRVLTLNSVTTAVWHSQSGVTGGKNVFVISCGWFSPVNYCYSAKNFCAGEDVTFPRSGYNTAGLLMSILESVNRLPFHMVLFIILYQHAKIHNRTKKRSHFLNFQLWILIAYYKIKMTVLPYCLKVHLWKNLYKESPTEVTEIEFRQKCYFYFHCQGQQWSMWTQHIWCPGHPPAKITAITQHIFLFY